jgi:hypothetical protein
MCVLDKAFEMKYHMFQVSIPEYLSEGKLDSIQKSYLHAQFLVLLTVPKIGN